MLNFAKFSLKVPCPKLSRKLSNPTQLEFWSARVLVSWLQCGVSFVEGLQIESLGIIKQTEEFGAKILLKLV